MSKLHALISLPYSAPYQNNITFVFNGNFASYHIEIWVILEIKSDFYKNSFETYDTHIF